MRLWIRLIYTGVCIRTPRCRYIHRLPTSLQEGRAGMRPIGLPQSRLISGLCGTTWHGLPRGDFYMNGPCMSMYVASYIRYAHVTPHPI